ncbi:MAG TPA: PAS domain S-box protein, partial [Flavisolibacter sp.]|nr:PAS domain S-box protein [Flavisolibacter sp.]
MSSTSLKTDPLSGRLPDISILDEHPLPAWIIDTGTYSIFFANRAATLSFGYTLEEYKQLSLLDLFPEESRILLFNKLTAAPAAINGSFCLQKKGMQKAWVDLFSAPVRDHSNLVQVTAVDNTARVQMEVQLQEERNRYKTYIEQSSEGIFCQEFLSPFPVSGSFEELIERCRTESFLSECNDAMARMYGFEKVSDLVGIRSNQLMDYSDPANLFAYKSFFDNNYRTINAESHEKDRDGNSRYFLNNAIGIVENGFLKRIWGTQRDITDKKKFEQHMSLLANLVEQTSEVLTAADLEYRPLTWNKAAEVIYGLSAAQVIGRPLRDFIDIHYYDHTRDEVRAAINTTGEWRGETWFIRPGDQKRVTLLMSFKLLKDEDQKPLGHIISAMDISERKEAELRLKESENRFREVADSAPVMIWMSDETDTIYYLNQRWVDFTGKNLMEVGSAGWPSFIHPDDVYKAKEKYEEAFRQKKQIVMIYRMLYKNGQYRWVHDISVPRFLNDGTFLGFIGSVVDIEEQKKQEDQLRYQATVLDNVSDIMVSTDLEFRVINFNKVAEKYYGISETQAIGNKMSDLIEFHFNGSSLEDCIYEVETKDFWEGEVYVTDERGKKKYFLQSLKGVYDENNRKIGFLAIGRDITERKKMEAQLRESEVFYRTLIADSMDGILLLDVEGNISFSSPSITRVLGYDQKDLEGKSGFGFIHPDDITWAVQSFQKEVIENPGEKSIVVRILNKAGQWVWCRVRGHNMLRHPQIRSMVVYLYNDTLRKEANDALKESEKRFRHMIRDLQIGVLLQQPDGTIMMSNNAMFRIFEVEEKELIGKRIWEVYPDAFREDGKPFGETDRPIFKAITEKRLVKDVVMGVLHPRKKVVIWMLISVDPILDDKGDVLHIICSFTDITERKKLDQKLIDDQLRHQKQLTQATIDGQEKERREIGKELHDNIG